MTLTELINRKANIGTALDILQLYFSKETTLEMINKDYMKMDTAIHNIECDLEPMQNKERVVVDKNFTVSFIE